MWWLVLACKPSVDGDGPTIRGLSVDPTDMASVFRVSFETEPSGIGAVEFGLAGAEPTLRVDDLGGSVHDLLVIGLSPGSWDLTATAGDAGGTTRAEPERVVVPEWPGAPTPELLAPRDPRTAGGYTLVDITGTPTPKIAMIDERGRIVWWFDGNLGDDVGAVDANVTPFGTISMGGSVPAGTNPLEIGLDGEILWRGAVQKDFAADGFVHHHTDVSPDGSRVALEKDVRDGRRGDRVVVRSASGQVEWTWSNWDHWVVPEPGPIEWSHLNWVEMHDDVFFVSDQHSGTIWKIDRATGDAIWTLGEGGTFELVGSTTWFSGQHRPHWADDGRLWVYDNRGLGDRSRVVAYDVDEQAMTATQVYEWDGEDQGGWFTGYWGSVHAFADDHVLVGSGNPDTRAAVEVDVPTGDVIGGFRFAPPFGFYRATHVDPAELFRVRPIEP